MTNEEYAALNTRVQIALTGGMSMEEVQALTAELAGLFTTRKSELSASHRIALEAVRSERLLKWLIDNE